MHFKGLDLNLLVFLDALLEEESVSKAALRLNVSQPAVSAALAKLRWHTGDELLQKIGRTTRLTPRAQAMVAPLKEILIQVESTIRSESDLDPLSLNRDFSISMTSYSAQILLPTLVQKVLMDFPNITCNVEDISFDTITRIKSGELDLCVTFLQTKLLNPKESLEGLSHTHIFSDRWVMVADIENHQISGATNFESFCEAPYVETRPGGMASFADRILDQSPSRPRTILSVPNFELAIASVVNSDCVTIVPSLMISKGVRPFVKVVTPPFEVPNIDEFLVWHSRNDDEPGHRWFREMLLESSSHLTEAGRG